MSNHDYTSSFIIPPSDRPSSDESNSDLFGSSPTPEQSPHPDDKIRLFYPGKNNKFGGITHSNLVVWDPQTRWLHLQYVAQLFPEPTTLMTDRTTVVVCIRHEHRNNDWGDRRRCWDIYFGPGSRLNFCQSYPIYDPMSDKCGDVHALIYALHTSKLFTDGPLLSQIYIVTDSYSLATLFTGESKSLERNPNTGLHDHE
jgi:hypothetical protein